MEQTKNEYKEKEIKMATAKGEVTTTLSYGDIKQTWVILDECSNISPKQWEYIRELTNHRMDAYARAFYANGSFYIGSSGLCMPSREHLHSMGYDVAVPVEEDNVFASRKVEIAV